MVRLDYYSPLPPERTGIADYSLELLPDLERRFDIRLRAADDGLTDDGRLPLYQMGNSPFHNWIYDALKARPGVVVLHDWVLAQFMGQRADFAREVSYALGAQRGRAVLMGAEPLNDPLNRRVLDLALGVIVHSEYVAALVRKEHPKLPVAVAPMPMQVWATGRELGEAVTFGLVGQLTRSKQVGLCLRSFGRYHAQHLSAQLLLIGEPTDIDLTALLDELPPAQRDPVFHFGYIPNLADFHATLDQADVLLNLRYPTSGETSAAALRGLAHGRPLIVSDVGWYAELPDAVAAKLDHHNEDALLVAMEQVVENYGRMSAAAAQHIADHHQFTQTVDQYAALIDQLR